MRRHSRLSPQEPDYPHLRRLPLGEAWTPHGPVFDMPLLDVEVICRRVRDVLKDAHVFTADHPEVARMCRVMRCGSGGHKNNAVVRQRLDPEGGSPSGTARRVVRPCALTLSVD